MTPLRLPASLNSLTPEQISARFRAHIERVVFRDHYSTPEQIQLADSLSVDDRLAFVALTDEACAMCVGSLPHDEITARLVARAEWLTPQDMSRLVGAAKYMMR